VHRCVTFTTLLNTSSAGSAQGFHTQLSENTANSTLASQNNRH